MVTSDDLAFFVVVASAASLADASRKLNVTPPAVSQRLRGLELRAGVHLIDRTGRTIALTGEGELVLAHAQAVAATMAALGEALADRTGKVSGHLRVAAPHGFGRVHVAPVIGAFAREYGAATITLDLFDHPGARLSESHDVVIHIGPAGPLNQIVTTLAPNRRLLCASPAYLRQAAAIGCPGDLTRHRCLAVRENDEDVTLWRFRRTGCDAATVRIDAAMSSNDGAVVRDWALADLGITLRSEWDVAADIAQDRLAIVLPGWEAPSADVVAMLGSRYGRSARTVAFLAMLRNALNPVPWRHGVNIP